MTVGSGLPDALARWLARSGPRIAVIAVLAYVVTRISAAAARRLEREVRRGAGLSVTERTKRVQTLTRIIQKTVTVLVTGMAGLMILRELGVDITPVLTGAGIAGLAVGFGAQTLVRDVISGFFLIIEDQVRVGDVAVVNGQVGLVEELNLRTIVLRDPEGAVHVFPNGEVKTLANRSKDFSYCVLDVGIRSDEDADRVADVLREACAGMMRDERFRPSILGPIEVDGVDAFAGGQLVVKARVKTVPLRQLDVGRELRKQIARRFAERSIEMPAPRIDVRVEGLEDILRAASAPTQQKP